ncbi:MAG: hypothetical protein U9Q89_08805 [Thermodesulfobacteriota bacterium]|nr:hypothetical protein [Thermodesulfobacteriota bacterium]
MNGYEPVIEVFPESAVILHLFKGAVGRCHHLDIHIDIPVLRSGSCVELGAQAPRWKLMEKKSLDRD